MSATPEQIAEVLGWVANDIASAAVNENAWEPNKDRIAQAETLRAAAALIRSLTATPSAADARIARLEEALKPFAHEAVLWDDLPEPPDKNRKLWIGSHANRFMTDEARFSLADLRRARAALGSDAG